MSSRNTGNFMFSITYERILDKVNNYVCEIEFTNR
jgi:hypothetical protein